MGGGGGPGAFVPRIVGGYLPKDKSRQRVAEVTVLQIRDETYTQAPDSLEHVKVDFWPRGSEHDTRYTMAGNFRPPPSTQHATSTRRQLSNLGHQSNHHRMRRLAGSGNSLTPDQAPLVTVRTARRKQAWELGRPRTSLTWDSVSSPSTMFEIRIRVLWIINASGGKKIEINSCPEPSSGFQQYARQLVAVR